LGANVTAVDANYENIQVAKAYKGEKIDFIHSTAEELVKQNRQFDAVCALEIIEHVLDPKDFVKNCSKLTKARLGLMKTNGFMFFSTINRTPISYLGTIILAENILNWVPKGTHTFEVNI
jgi:ubiquinone biosynthesis O-methyltransferase